MTDPVPAPEQQGEPVCRACGLPVHDGIGCVEAVERVMFPPTPPSSEDAEAFIDRWGPQIVRTWPACRESLVSEVEFREAAIRRPLEEERDRLREQSQRTAHEFQIVAIAAAENLQRAEAAEAQVAKLREALKAIRWHVAPESIVGMIVGRALDEDITTERKAD